MASPVRKAQKVSDKGLSDSPTKRTRAMSAHEDSGMQGISRNNSHTAFENVEGKMLDDDFAALGIGGLLELDPRPTFVLNLDTNSNDMFAPDFANKSFQSNSQLKDVLPFKTRSESPLHSPKLATTGFRLWIQALARDDAMDSPSFYFCGFTWMSFKVQNRWLIISGQESPEESTSDVGSSPRSEGLTTPQPPSSTDIEHQVRIKNIRTTSEDSIMSEALPPSFVTPGTPDVSNSGSLFMYPQSLSVSSDVLRFTPPISQRGNNTPETFLNRKLLTPLCCSGPLLTLLVISLHMLYSLEV